MEIRKFWLRKHASIFVERNGTQWRTSPEDLEEKILEYLDSCKSNLLAKIIDSDDGDFILEFKEEIKTYD